MATTKFGYRHWGSTGELHCEYWISDLDLLADGKDTPPAASTLKFTAGSLSHLHNPRNRNHDYNNQPYTTPRCHSHSHGSNHERLLDTSHSHHSHYRKPEYLLHTFNSSGTAKPKRRLFSRRRHYQPSISSDQESSSPSSISTHSMSLTTQTTMASTPTTEKRKSGFLHRLHHGLGHNRRRSSIDVTSQSPQTRTPTATGRPPSQRAPTNTTIQPANTTLQPPTINGMSNSNHDAPPQIKIRAPTARHDASEEVHYPDGLSPAPLSPGARSNKGITWAENYEGGPPRPRRTSSAATHGRRSSIFSKDEAGNFDNPLSVDAGVGSKARRLSVALPDDLQVDECSLEEHFSYLQRMKHKEIGQGGAAIVRLMQSKTAGSSSEKVYAVKEFRLRDANEETEYEYERKIKSEFAISKACDHPNIVTTFRLCHSGDQWYHVMEYCELGDLNDLIKQGAFEKPEDRNCMFKQLVRGVDYLHSRGIAHRDLKSENLLVNKQGCLKIADFGTGEVFSGLHPGVRNCRRQSIIDPNEPIRECQPGWVGSMPYMAPEIVQRHGKYDPRAVDVWAVAIVYITMCFGGTPWDTAVPDCRNFGIFMQYWDRFFEQFEDHEICDGRAVPGYAYKSNMACLDDQETRVMLMGMLHPEPAKRWTIRDVLESKPVVEAPCCQQERYSDDIKTRQKKSLHNHVPDSMKKKIKAKS